MSAIQRLVWGVLLIMGTVAGAGEFTNAVPPTVELDQVREWLQRHPESPDSRPERRSKLVPLQAACDALSPEAYKAYVAAWSEPAKADALEREGALYYLARAHEAAMAEIGATQVRSGAVVWLFYNMGCVIKTPDACVGLDLAFRRAPALAPLLDVLLVTHEHGDHQYKPVIDAMRAAGKPVVTRGVAGTIIVTQATERLFGPVRVKIDIGDHHRETPTGLNNMLMYQVDLGAAALGTTVYDSGDGNNPLKMKPDRPVTAYLVHVNVGMSVAEAVRQVQPGVTLIAHVLELGHSPRPPQAWRWSFDSAYRVAESLPAGRALVPTWGERWLAPGTELAAPAHHD